MLDYWLRNSHVKPKWKDVAEALKEIELYQLAESILNIYETGRYTRTCMMYIITVLAVLLLYVT